MPGKKKAKKASKKAPKKEPAIPVWYFRYSMPFVPAEPQEKIAKRNLVNTIRVYDGDELPIEPGKKYYLEVENNYDDADDIYICEFTETLLDNPHYKAQLKQREEALARVEEWKVITATYDERQKADADAAELALYKRLKKKYG